MSILKDKKIAVLAGGISCEREISLISGRAVLEALQEQGLDVISLDPAGNFLKTLKDKKIDLVFLALHGSFGEDGAIQDILDQNQISYTGSGAMASRRAFDKSQTQKIFKEHNILVPNFQILKSPEEISLAKKWKAPFVVKPATCGSSVGITIVRDEKEVLMAVQKAFEYSETVLIEEYVLGRELTVGILGEETLPIVEVCAKRKFYDYEAKYKDNQTEYKVPADLSDAKAKEIAEQAYRAFNVLGCEVLSRVDVILSETGKPYVLEINTIPGLTNKSLLPKAAKAKGLPFADLCVKILELSLLKKAVAV